MGLVLYLFICGAYDTSATSYDVILRQMMSYDVLLQGIVSKVRYLTIGWGTLTFPTGMHHMTSHDMI